MRSGKNLLGLIAAGSLASLAAAQTPQLLVQDGSTIIGMGSLTQILYVQVLDSGTWVAQVDTNFSDTTRDGALLRSGFVTLREGSPLFSPANTTLDDWDSTNMSQTGHLAMAMRASVSGSSREALYWNTVPIALLNTVLTSPLVGSGTTWQTFDICKINSNNEVYVIGDVANPNVAGAREATLCKFTMDAVGNILATEVLYTKGQFIDVLETTVNDLPTTENALAVNDRGDFLTLVSGTGAVNAFLINGTTIVAQEGTPSPVPGRNWRPNGGLVNQPRLSINQKGEYLFAGALEGSGGTYLIVKNGEKFAQAGDVYPSFSTGALINGTASGLYLSNRGDVFWRADSANNNDDAYLRNFTPIIQANSTVFNGDLVTAVEQTDTAYSVSPNGRFFAGRVDLQAAGEAVLFVDFGLIEDIPGCLGNDATLDVTDGLALPGSSMTFEMDLGQSVGALPILLFSSRPSRPGSECGVPTAYGELLISNSNRVGRVVLPAWNLTPSTITLNIPADPSLVNRTFYAQGLFRDPPGSSAPDFALTNGLRFVFGAP